MSCCTIFKMHDVYSVLHAIYIHMCYKFLACESKMASIFSGQFSGLPTELPTISILESSGLPTPLPTVSIYGRSGQPTELPTVSIYGSSGQPNLHGKIPMGSPWAAHSVAHVQPTGSEVGSSPVFSVWVPSSIETVGNSVDIPLKCPLLYLKCRPSLIHVQDIVAHVYAYCS